MRREIEVYLWDLREGCREILEFTAGKDVASYENDRLLQLAIERCFTIIGEAIVRIRIHFPDEFARMVDAQRVISFRNQLVHLYDQINHSQVWEIITNSVPVLLAETETSLERLKK